ncbi:hypothetical protein D3C80_1468460 [compost metagenome]
MLFPRQGAFHRFFPAAVAIVTLGRLDTRTEFTLNDRFFLQLIQILPEANRQTSQIRGTQRGDFAHFWTLNAGAQNVGLELHQEVVRHRAAVHAQSVQTNAGVGLHCFQHVTRLVGDRFQRRADDVVRVHPTRQAENRAARIRVPIWRAQACECRYHVHTVGVFHFGGEIFGIERIADELHFVAQPLNGCTRHEDRTFQRIIHFAAWAAGDGGQQAIL